MQKVIALACLIGFLSMAGAQTINVRGKVSNASGQAVGGASVELVKRGLKATTGADGMYSLTGSVGVANTVLDMGGMAMAGGMLRIGLGRPASIRVEAFDVRGNLLRRETVPDAAPGSYAWDLDEGMPSDRMMIIKASAGREERVFRYLPQAGGGASGRQIAAFAAAGAALAKAAAAVDTLKVTAAGYQAKEIPVASWDTTANIALEAESAGGKNPPVKSSGCGKPASVTTGKKTITSSNQSRSYIIDVPANYDPNKAYRFFYCSHWIGSTSEAVANGSVNPGGGAANWGYYGLKRMATTANEPAIFVAPQSDGQTWQQKDHALFDDILAFAKQNLCVDETRVFATGFSFGGMITYSLSTNHQKVIRAAVGIAPANYNIWLPSPIPRDPIAWMSTTGMSDGTCPWGDGVSRGAQAIAKQRAQDNGCTVPATIPTAAKGGKSHLCYDFTGCKAGYPVKACTFDGGHIAAHADGGTGDNGLTSWIPTESWKFFTQF